MLLAHLPLVHGEVALRGKAGGASIDWAMRLQHAGGGSGPTRRASRATLPMKGREGPRDG